MLIMFIKNIIYLILEELFSLFPINENYVLFESFGGQYNDNPKYISEKLHELNDRINIIWVLSNKSNETISIPNYVTKVKMKSIKFFYFKKTSKFLITNNIGFNLILQDGILSRIRYFIYKRKSQSEISTWHGVPIKKIGYDREEYKKYNKIYGKSTADYFLTGCNYFSNIMQKSCFGNNMHFLEFGTPRTDILFNNKNEYLYSKLGLSNDFKYVLFAPTYRNNAVDSGIIQIKMINIKELLNALSERFGGNWKLILRVHHMVLELLKNDKVFCNDLIINGNMHDDMNEYLSISSALLTDWSSSIYDNALTDRPCFLFAYDLEKYNSNRGFYIDLNDLPYKFCNNFDELINCIKKYDEIENATKVKKFLNKIGNFEDGNSSLRVSNFILEHLKTYK